MVDPTLNAFVRTATSPTDRTETPLPRITTAAPAACTLEPIDQTTGRHVLDFLDALARMAARRVAKNG